MGHRGVILTTNVPHQPLDVLNRRAQCHPVLLHHCARFKQAPRHLARATRRQHRTSTQPIHHLLYDHNPAHYGLHHHHSNARDALRRCGIAVPVLINNNAWCPTTIPIASNERTTPPPTHPISPVRSPSTLPLTFGYPPTLRCDRRPYRALPAPL
ncbi:hypothetical protein DL93DRAFT_1657367 [Clavulina sp. PMI_390]|nr:hypothetical protein DL93DRAFT_1657367 [Clavulina sp. PMI_390]